MVKKSQDIEFYLLTTLLFFQGISGVYGGGALVLNPTGKFLQMPPGLLDGSPFDTYLVPGIILLLVLGIFPLTVFLWCIEKKNVVMEGGISGKHCTYHLDWSGDHIDWLSLRTASTVDLWGSRCGFVDTDVNAFCPIWTGK